MLLKESEEEPAKGATRRRRRTRRGRRAIVASLAAPLAVAAYLLFWPVHVKPEAWSPPADQGFTGDFAPNAALHAADLIGVGAPGPEDVAIDADGAMYAGLRDGRIVRISPDGATIETFADTGGRPLGLDFDRQGRLIVGDADRGLLRIDRTGAIEVLATEHAGIPFGFTNDVDVASDGTIYFSDASSRWSIRHVTEDIVEHRPSGRLLAWDPATGNVRLLLDRLAFANGVALSPEEDFVLVVETASYRVRRLWLTGEQAGRVDTFIENLPGFPDGISCNGRDRFWLALEAPRSRVADVIHPHPWLKRLIFRLPETLRPKPAAHGCAVGLDVQGHVAITLQDPEGEHFAYVTSVEEHAGHLYLGSLELEAFARLPAPGSAGDR